MDSHVDAALEYTQEFSEDAESDLYSINVGWSTAFANTQSLRISLGYNSSQSLGLSESEGFHADLGYNWVITDNLLLDAQLGYNSSALHLLPDDDLTDSLVTDTETGSLNETEVEGYSFMLGMRYTFGSVNRSSIIAARPGTIGSGTIVGQVFVDVNGDGLPQANEHRLANIDVFLDSIYPSKTDQNGEFRFSNVGIGSHYVFVDEGNLPLPWMLGGQEFITVEVKLRTTSKINIAVQDSDSMVFVK